MGTRVSCKACVKAALIRQHSDPCARAHTRRDREDGLKKVEAEQKDRLERYEQALNQVFRGRASDTARTVACLPATPHVLLLARPRVRAHAYAQTETDRRDEQLNGWPLVAASGNNISNVAASLNENTSPLALASRDMSRLNIAPSESLSLTLPP